MLIKLMLQNFIELMSNILKKGGKQNISGKYLAFR